MPTTRALQTVVKRFATLAHPAYSPRRNSRHKRKIRHVMGHYRASGNHCRAAYGIAAHDSAVGTQRGSRFYQRGLVNPMNGEMGSRRKHISKDTRRTAKDIILQTYTLIYRHIVLYANTIANVHIGSHIHILSQRAVATNGCSALDMAEMPYLGTIANGDVFFHITAFMNKDCHLQYFLCIRKGTPSNKELAIRKSV